MVVVKLPIVVVVVVGVVDLDVLVVVVLVLVLMIEVEVKVVCAVLGLPKISNRTSEPNGEPQELPVRRKVEPLA